MADISSLFAQRDQSKDAVVASNQAQQYLERKKKRGVTRIIRAATKRKRETDDDAQFPELRGGQAGDVDPPLITLDDSGSASNVEEANLYRWAMVMENQRGFTLFSTPHYSSASLLPNDPPAFAVQNTTQTQAVGVSGVSSLEAYTLPSPVWAWVSKYWMVDMRGEGDVDSQGWEHNWSFYGNNWRSQVGSLNRGGWVRRRRWVRLMMKPTKSLHQATVNMSPVAYDWRNVIGEVWRGNTDDWRRCWQALKSCSRDGLKLELWNSWIRAFDDSLALQHIRAVLRSHGDEIIQSFVYPETRFRFLALLRDAHLDQEIDSDLLNRIASEFLSYMTPNTNAC